MLVTVLAEHLIGIEKVHSRIMQLKGLVPKGSEWLQIAQPKLPRTVPLIRATCLPCQQAYICAGIILAKRFQILNLAMGYSGYQSSWPEQTPSATKGLTMLLRTLGIRLHLPVYDIQTREDAIDELRRAGLAGESLEQKCLKQGFNIELPGGLLATETDNWLDGISETMKRDPPLAVQITYREKIENIAAAPSHGGTGDSK
jgi:hypothetical protein